MDEICFTICPRDSGPILHSVHINKCALKYFYYASKKSGQIKKSYMQMDNFLTTSMFRTPHVLPWV